MRRFQPGENLESVPGTWNANCKGPRGGRMRCLRNRREAGGVE